MRREKIHHLPAAKISEPPRCSRGVVRRSASDHLDRVLHCAMSERASRMWGIISVGRAWLRCATDLVVRPGEGGGNSPAAAKNHQTTSQFSGLSFHRMASDHFDRAVHCTISGRPRELGDYQSAIRTNAAPPPKRNKGVTQEHARGICDHEENGM